MQQLRRFIVTAVSLASVVPSRAWGHDGVPHASDPFWSQWAWEPLTFVALALWAGLYAAGVTRLWRSAGVGRGIARWEAASFAVGWLVLFIALVSPIHTWGEIRFSIHMIQHELMMLVAAPLLVLGRPLVALLKALPAGSASSLARLSHQTAWNTIWGTLSRPLTAWIVHAVILWGWHAPALMDAVLHNKLVHALQHSTFLFSALLFWWALVQNGRNASGYGAGVLYTFTTALHSGLLGVLITYATRILYPTYAASAAAWNFSAIEDQQVGGMIMWMPACAVYIIAGLLLFAGWMRESESRVRRWEQQEAQVRANPI